MLKIALLCAHQDLALRGHDESEDSENTVADAGFLQGGYVTGSARKNFRSHAHF